MDLPVELRQLRYFVAVAEELHFGRAAERLHMSQSPLSRAIRELERELGLVLFVRTTRRVELTPAGSALLERARRALAEIDAAVDGARRAAEADAGVLGVGYTPFTRLQATRIAEEVVRERLELQLRLEEDVTPELLRQIASHELTAAVVMETPAAGRRYGVRIDALRDEPLLAALPATHDYARAEAIPIGAFAAECVLLPREPPGGAFNAWLSAVVRAAGFELERTLKTLSAPWDRRMLPVADGEAVSLFVGEWVEDSIAGVAAVPFDPPLTFPIDLASSPTDGGELLASTARRLRDAEGWLTHRPAHSELPSD
ncbi:MAG TPA: LysR family transcriptional regulator [Gaiellaceae bacterium]|nr:LysR family transcriptional regulator [Gaiellaceae bacterium]